MNKIRWHSSTHEHKGTSGSENQMRGICIFHTARYREKRPPVGPTGAWFYYPPERSAEPPAPASDSIPQTWRFNALMSVCVSPIKRLHFWKISERLVSPAGGTARPRAESKGTADILMQLPQILHAGPLLLLLLRRGRVRRSSRPRLQRRGFIIYHHKIYMYMRGGKLQFISDSPCRQPIGKTLMGLWIWESQFRASALFSHTWVFFCLVAFVCLCFSSSFFFYQIPLSSFGNAII